MALALHVLVGKQLLSKLLADNTTKDFSSAVPFVVLLAVVLAVASVVAIVRTELERLLSELVARSAMHQVVDAACRADLARFKDPKFHDRLQRAIVKPFMRPLQMTVGLLAVGSSALAVIAVGTALATIEALFLVLGLVAAVPPHSDQHPCRSGALPLRHRTDPHRPRAVLHPGIVSGKRPWQGDSRTPGIENREPL